MTPEQRAAYVAEVDRRFRERTPSIDLLSALPEQRVGRSEMTTWAEENGIRVDIEDAIALGKLMPKLFRRLRHEFPNEAWETV